VTRLLVASTGGHLRELTALAPRIWPPDANELWVTSDSEQSRSLLAGRRVRYVRHTPPRDCRSILVNTRAAWGLLDEDVDTVLSNGAGIAISFLPLAQAKGISSHYIECAARAEGPSMAGRIIERAGGVMVYTQYPELANSRWRYSGSAFDGFRPVEVPKPPALLTVFVTVGTLDFSFMGLLMRLQSILPKTTKVVVQAGTDSNRLDWPGATVSPMMGFDEIRANVAQADVVVAHAGIGSVLDALGGGKVPVLVPRVQSRGEHVDDHQSEMARHLADRGLAVVADSATISLNDLSRTLTKRVERVDQCRFVLQ
jgi:UDP-N-acetylglucosamine--N-acetylmuramyl-(pentapeptide) pyrophosphoryl-undecaprenol N-acetylglucosamine transferase